MGWQTRLRNDASRSSVGTIWVSCRGQFSRLGSCTTCETCFFTLFLPTLKSDFSLIFRVTVGVNLFAVVSLLTATFPPAVRAVLTMPNVALQNAMACRVYRLLKLGFIEEEPTTIRTSQLPEYEDTESLRYITNANTATSNYNSQFVDSIGMMELTKDLITYGRNRTFPAAPAPLQISVNEIVEVAVEDTSDGRWRPRTHRSV